MDADAPGRREEQARLAVIRRQRMAEILREARQRKGLSQAKVAAEIGADVKTITRLESGGVSPNIDTLTALADLYGETLDRLSGRQDGDLEAAAVLAGTAAGASAYRVVPARAGISYFIENPEGEYVLEVPIEALEHRASTTPPAPDAAADVSRSLEEDPTPDLLQLTRMVRTLATEVGRLRAIVQQVEPRARRTAG